MSNNKEIDWEELRYEIAKAMMPQVTVLVMDVLNRGQRIEGAAGKTVMQVVAGRTLWYADALVLKTATFFAFFQNGCINDRQ